MTAQVLTNCVILVGGNDITNFSGMIDTGGQVAMQDAPHFGSKGYMIRVPGLKSYQTAIGGNADYGSATAVSNVFKTSTVGTQYAVSALPTGGATAGDPATFTRGRLDSFKSPTGNVGALAGFAMNITSDTAQIDGMVLQPLAAQTTTGTGTITAMTPPTATQKLYAALHVTSVSGTNPTLDVVVQSAALVGFGSPTDRITFTTATTTGYQWATPVAGAITNGYWRVSYTISGTDTPTFSFAVVVGVLDN